MKTTMQTMKSFAPAIIPFICSAAILATFSNFSEASLYL